MITKTPNADKSCRAVLFDLTNTKQKVWQSMENSTLSKELWKDTVLEFSDKFDESDLKVKQKESSGSSVSWISIGMPSFVFYDDNDSELPFIGKAEKPELER